MNRTTWLLAAAGVLAAMLPFASVEAAAIRTFVSGHGADTNPCNLASPCRTLATALANTSPGGEIYVLDSAGYGPVTINQSVTIGVRTTIGGVNASPSANAITINAGASDKIVLRGLAIIGGGTGNNGVVFNTGASLVVEDCSISGFIFAGIIFQPNSPSQLYVSNTRVSNNGPGGVGIYVHPSIPSGSGVVEATFERLEARDDSQAGVFVDGRASGPSVKLNATIADSVLADSATDGVHSVSTAVTGAPTFVMVRNTTISNNAFAVSVEAGSTLALGRSTVSGNGQAFFTSGGGSLLSYGDNNVDGNGSLGPTPSPVAFH